MFNSERAMMVKDIRDKERTSRTYDTSNAVEMDREVAAVNVQRMIKGYGARLTSMKGPLLASSFFSSSSLRLLVI